MRENVTPKTPGHVNWSARCPRLAILSSPSNGSINKIGRRGRLRSNSHARQRSEMNLQTVVALLTQVLVEEFEGARPREFGRLFVITRRRVVVKAVLFTIVHVSLCTPFYSL